MYIEPKIYEYHIEIKSGSDIYTVWKFDMDLLRSPGVTSISILVRSNRKNPEN